MSNSLRTLVSDAQMREILSQPWNIQGINTNGAELVISVKSDKRKYGQRPSDPKANTKQTDNFRFDFANADQAKIYAASLRRWVKTAPWPRKKRERPIDCNVVMPAAFDAAIARGSQFTACADGRSVIFSLANEPVVVFSGAKRATLAQEADRAGLNRQLARPSVAVA